MSGDARAHAYRNVIITAATAGLAGLLFGYDTGVIAGALLQITPDFGLGSFESGLVVAAVPIGAVFGAWYASRYSDRQGRRTLILTAAVIFIIGAIASALAPGTGILVISRIVIGGAIGVASARIVVKCGACAEDDQRCRSDRHRARPLLAHDHQDDQRYGRDDEQHEHPPNGAHHRLGI